MLLRVLCALLFLAPTTIYAQSPYRSYALSVVQDIRKDIQKCGLKIIPFNSSNPRDARRAIVAAKDGRYLAWYLERGNAFGAVHEFRDYRTFGFTHTIRYGLERLRFRTPAAGLVARVNSQQLGTQRVYVMYCQFERIRRTADFKACVQSNYVQPIVQQLCNA